MTRKESFRRSLAVLLPMLAACGTGVPAAEAVVALAAGGGDEPVVVAAANRVQPQTAPVVTAQAPGGRLAAGERGRQPAAPSGVTVAALVHGTPPQADFFVTGPFFEAARPETLVIRAVPEEEEDSVAPPAEARRMFRGRYDFYRGDVLRYRLDDYWTLGLLGVCSSPQSGRLGILVRPWVGGASNDAGLLRVEYDPQTGTMAARGFQIMAPPRVPLAEFAATCGPGEALWGERFVPCSCDGPFEYWLEAGALMARLTERVLVGGERRESGVSALAAEGFQEVGDPPTPRRPRGPVPDVELSPLFEEISRFVETHDAPRRDRGDEDRVHPDGLSLARYDSPAYTLVSVTLDTVDFWESQQLIWVRPAREDSWRPLYAAGYARPDGFRPARVRGFDRDDTVRLADVCVADCNAAWEPAQRAIVAWSLRTLAGRIVEDESGRQPN